LERIIEDPGTWRVPRVCVPNAESPDMPGLCAEGMCAVRDSNPEATDSRSMGPDDAHPRVTLLVTLLVTRTLSSPGRSSRLVPLGRYRAFEVG
jgi:hypothetical protein